MTKEKLPQEYLQWIKDEKDIAGRHYNSYKDTVRKGFIPFHRSKSTKHSFYRLTAAAILIIALGTTLWVKKDDIFKPNYTEEQIALSYEHAVKTLAVCASSLSKEMGKLKKLNQIPESIDNLKELENEINNK